MKPVLDAVRRWEEKGLVDAALAARLRGELEEYAAGGSQRLFRYALATTGAAILVIAGGVFLDWAWPLMTDAHRSVLMVLGGLAVYQFGSRLEGRGRWIPASYLMQTAALGLVAIGIAYSERAWPDGSGGAVAMGLLGLAVPPVLGWRSLARNSVLPAVHLAFALFFVGVFLDRAAALPLETVLWAVDGILVVVMAGLLAILRSDPDATRHPWALNAFAMALYAGFAMVVMTGDEALNWGDGVVYALDAWLFLVAAVTVYGIHWAPEGLREEWFARQLALAQLVWIPLGFATNDIADGPPEAAVMAVGGSGVVGFLYARETGTREVLVVSALSLVIAAWYWGVERAGALGAVLALALTAALLFWFSGRGEDGTGEEG